MVKSILLTFLLFFAIFGICELIYFIKMLIVYPGFRVNNYVLIKLKKTYSIKQLNYIWQKMKWYGDAYALGIIALTDLLDDDEIYECSQFIINKNIKLINSDTIKNAMT